jgi:Immunity protein 21
VQPVPGTTDTAWQHCGPGHEGADRFIQILMNTIPNCSGNGADEARVPGGRWFTSTHAGLTTTLWVRAGGSTWDPEAPLSYAVAGSPRSVELERERWSRVVKETHRASVFGADAGGLSSSLHIAYAEPQHSHVWVASMGGPLVAVPVSVLAEWGGFADREESDGAGRPDDYDRACAVNGRAGVISVGEGGTQVLVLRDKSTSCYVPERQLFIRWLGADSEEELIAAANIVLADITADWEACGVWEVDGPAVLVDSSIGGSRLDIDSHNSDVPEHAQVLIQAGRWLVRAGQWKVSVDPDGPTTVGLIQLIAEKS